jgi:hypothetical protein
VLSLFVQSLTSFETDKERHPFCLCRAAAEEESRVFSKLLQLRGIHGDCVTREASLSMFILIL